MSTVVEKASYTEEYLLLIEPLLDNVQEIEHTDIRFALRNTTVNENSYHTYYNCVISCLKELWDKHYSLNDILKEEFKTFILKHEKLLSMYSQHEINRIVEVFHHTITRYIARRSLQNEELVEDSQIMMEEVHSNIYIIRDIITVSNSIFKMYEIEWLNIRRFTLDLDDILRLSISTDYWIILNSSFKEMIMLL